MELVPNEGTDIEVIAPAEPVTTRTLTTTVKVDKTADIDTIVNNLKEFGEVTHVSYYENTFKTNAQEPDYLY